MKTKSARKCQLDGCDNKISTASRSDAKYCTPNHQRRAGSRRSAAKRRIAADLAAGKDIAPKSLDSAVERLIVSLRDDSIDELIVEGRWTQAQAARHYKVTGKLMSEAMKLVRDRAAVGVLDEEWKMSPDVRAMMMLKEDGTLDDFTGGYDDVEAALKWATEAADQFLRYERSFFFLPGKKPWIRKLFHRIWVIEVMLAYATGGYLQILSPPRHGKSELMIHICCWLIGRNPDIRILWVAASGEKGVAGDMVASVGNQLSQNTKLRLAILGPGNHWAPATRTTGTKWTRAEIEVTNRSTVITGSTLVALGRGSKILSRNADFIFCDDIEDTESTEQAHTRKKTRRWFGITLDSRKEEHTPMVVIGSRQHLDDLYGYNLENPSFRCITDSAHDEEGCQLDPENVTIHIECMLFPEVRTYRWLMTKKVGAESREEAGTYDLVYLNDPQSEGITIFVKEEVHGSRNPSRVLGLSGLPENHELIGGLDPSATGFQSGFLWGLAPMEGRSAKSMLEAQDFLLKRWMVDLENRKGGGARNALQLIQLWFTQYELRHWVIEESGAWAGEGSYRQDLEIKRYCKANDIHLEGLETSGTNKYDKTYGVAAGSRLFRDHMIDLPYGDERARTKVDAYTRQVLRFTEDATQQARRKSDIHMASWLPVKAIRRKEKEQLAELSSAVTLTVDNDYPVSYPDLDGLTEYNEAPWS